MLFNHYYLEGDFEKAERILSSMFINASNYPVILGRYGRKNLKESIKRSFRQQRTPDGQAWEKSRLSQTDPTGSPRLTMIRSTALFQDMQTDSNYLLEPYNELGAYTSVQAETKDGKKTGFFYGEFHNFGKWNFAGMDIESIDNMTEQVSDFILSGWIP